MLFFEGSAKLLTKKRLACVLLIKRVYRNASHKSPQHRAVIKSFGDRVWVECKSKNGAFLHAAYCTIQLA